MPLENITPQMRWDCEKHGCYHKKKQPKFGVFAGCLPPRMSFTDLDGILEIGGNLLILEWKTTLALPAGQRILFSRISLLCPALVLVVEGNAENMTVTSICEIRKGHISPPIPGNLDTLRTLVANWAEWARANPVLIKPDFKVPSLITNGHVT